LFNYVVNGTIDPTLDQINAIEDLKRLAAQKNEVKPGYFARCVMSLIDKGRLPYEVVTGIIKPDKAIWEHLMKQMPIFALTRHLNTLEEAGVFNNSKSVDYVVGQLTNAEIIGKSRMLPFRFSTAFKNYKGNLKIANALKKALDLSLSNITMLPGRNAFFLDVSGSMSGDYLEIGSLLGIAALKKSKDALFLCFGSELKLPRIDVNDTVITNMDACRKVFGGGTNTDLTMKYLLGTVPTASRGIFGGGGYQGDFPLSAKTTSSIKVDNIVIITDEQQNGGSPVVKEFRKYRETVNKNAKLFIIDVAPYTGRIASQDEPGVTFIYGWSDSVLDILKYAMEGNGRHVEQIKNMRL
jgi:60 kDa SS-A/Ro ribonucleoprotein